MTVAAAIAWLRRRRYALAALAVPLVLVVGAYWLVASNSGLQAAAMLAGSLSGGRLELQQAEGSLLGPLDIARLTWTDGADSIVAERVRIELNAGDLGHGLAHFTRLSIERLALDLAPSDQPSDQPPQLPADLSLPLDVRIDRIEIGELRQHDATVATAFAASFTSENKLHRIDELRVDIAGLAIGGHGEIGAEAPFALAVGGWLQGSVAERPLRLDIKAAGTLDAIELALTSSEKSLRGEAQATVAPFAALPISRLHVDLTGLDPAAWQADAPGATLDLTADFRADGDEAALAGEFSLHNRKPGTLDHQRLPIDALDGHLRWRPADIAFSQLDAALAGGGHLRGDGTWQAGKLALDLRAEAVDATALHSALRRSRLGGPINLRTGPDQQSASFDLADARFTLKGQATRRGDDVAIDDLLVRANDARLTASGKVALDDSGKFAVRGELARFDPARFVDLPRLPAARISGTFEATGHRRPQLQVDGRFELRDSLLAGRPLAGRGDVDIDGVSVRRLDLHLTAGANRLDTEGAFGKAGDSLKLVLVAPELAPYKLGGGLEGTADVSGTAAMPVFDLHLTAKRFSVPGSFTVQGLDLDATAGNDDAAPLRLRLKLAALATPDRPDLARNVAGRIDGTRAQHTLSASAELTDQGRLSLAARGGMVATDAGPRWRGSLTEFDWRGGPDERSLHLAQAAPLQLAADGWSFGPAQVAGDSLQGKLDAHADMTRMHLALDATGPRLGRVSATLDAGAAGPWRLEKAAPWQARLDADSADLAWLGPLIGEGAATGGRARVQLQLAGTPARPLASGSIHGEALAVRLPDQGLRLENGQLDATLTDNRLRVSRLTFDSPWQAPPRALVLTEGEAVTALGTRPGHIEAVGEMQVDGGNLFLDVKLDRLGIASGPTRWLVASGSGRLDWRDGGLGITAQVATDAGYWQLPRLDAPRLSDDVVVKRRDGESPAPARSPLALDVEVSLGRHFRFSGAGLESRLAGKLKLTAAGRDAPRASGAIRAMDGRFEAYGQKLYIERGNLNFAGLVDNPALDVLAVRRGLPVTPGVEVTGTVRRPVVRLVSDPDLPDAEKLSWLVLGRAPDQVGAGDASLLLAAASSLLGGESGGVLQDLKRDFGIEEIGVRSGQLGSDGRGIGSQVVGGSNGNMNAGEQIFTVGTRLSADTMLTYEQALGTTESLVKLTQTLSRHLSLVGRTGADNAIDLFYTFTFGR